MRILPILFNTEMVCSVLDGYKTKTRRIIKPQPPCSADLVMGKNPDVLHAFDQEIEHPGMTDRRVYMSPYRPGDILYVRETWAEWTGGYVYMADGANSPYPLSFVDRWHPSIHMPKEAARLFLRVTDVRAERLQDITEEDAKSEGIREFFIGMGESGFAASPHSLSFYDSPIGAFAALWNSTLKHMDHLRYCWAANPWVWVNSFERCEKPDESGS